MAWRVEHKMTKTLKKILVAIAALPLAASLLMAHAPPASAQEAIMEPQAIQLAPCKLHQDMSDLLNTRFDEKRHSWGLVGEEAVMEIYVSKTGTWSIVMTSMDGRSCIIAAGHSFDTLPAELAGNPA